MAYSQEDFTDSEDLLGSLAYGIRKFYLSGSWEEILLGVLLEETADSFLIALPARVSNKDNVYILEEVVANVPYARFLKSEFRAVSFAQEIHEQVYVQYLRAKSPSIFPELLDMIGYDIIDKDEDSPYENPSFSENPAGMGEIEEEGFGRIEETEKEIDTPAGILVKGNLTDSDLHDKVEKAIEEGRFIPPSQGKLPN